MSNLKIIRESQHLTQEELAKKSNVSVRTIQRIETGKEPKGFTLRVLAKALSVTENKLLINPLEKRVSDYTDETTKINYTTIKLINLSSIPFIIIPTLNIIIPLLLMFKMKQKNGLTKQLISIQILWTILAPIIFMLGIFLKLGQKFTLVLLILIVLSNVFIVLRNAREIDKNKKLYFKLNFSII